jgi:hypothetical protein
MLQLSAAGAQFNFVLEPWVLETGRLRAVTVHNCKVVV